MNRKLDRPVFALMSPDVSAGSLAEDPASRARMSLMPRSLGKSCASPQPDRVRLNTAQGPLRETLRGQENGKRNYRIVMGFKP